jgi:hypothetical protein
MVVALLPMPERARGCLAAALCALVAAAQVHNLSYPRTVVYITVLNGTPDALDGCQLTPPA